MKTLLVLILMIGGSWSAGGTGWAQATAPAKTDPLALNPATGCMEARFQAEESDADRTVPAAAVLESLRGGHCVRLQGAIVQGDLDLTTLPVNGVDAQGEELIALPGALVLHGSRLEGRFNAAKRANGPRVRFGGPLVMRDSALGAVELGGVQFGAEVTFDGTRFAQGLKLEGARFERGASWKGAQFARPVFFSNLAVAGRLDLEGAQFASLVRAFGVQAEEVVLDGARFGSTVDLSRGQVGGLSAAQVEFEQAVDLSYGLWQGPVTFRQAAFRGKADFSNTLIEGRANFSGALFESHPRFFAVTFARSARFAGARFAGGATFSGARFSAEADFSGARFSATALFAQAQFLGWVDFGGARFEDLSLEGARFLHPAGAGWAGATFEGPVTLEGVVSLAPWQLSPEQVQGGVEGKLPSAQTAPRLELWLLVAIAAGVAGLLVLSLH